MPGFNIFGVSAAADCEECQKRVGDYEAYYCSDYRVLEDDFDYETRRDSKRAWHDLCALSITSRQISELTYSLGAGYCMM